MQEQLQGMAIPVEDRSLIDVMREISALVKTQLQTIKQRQEADEEESSVGDKEYMNVFVQEEYVTKNIRVMPMGGLGAIDNQSEHTSKYYASGMGGTIDSETEDNKHNHEALLQMLDQRN